MSAIDRDFALVLRHLLDAFERRDAKEVARFRSLISGPSQKRDADDSKKDNDREMPDADALRADFAAYATRESLDQHIRDAYPSRADIEAVARALRLSIMKSDNIDALVQRIVDATVGYRLRSTAIRGEAGSGE
ncbi:MAG: hypothetical protein R3C31_08470 [Hyphomonadaceae bacterium]